ncbi:MAG: hypothetical protein CL917_11420 [Deltaproteobacteria bacterium]|nr:hypothetical protein [Deltaproteobacteria bacterium]
MMNSSAGPLEGLRDIHLPDPISFWPIAAGWWLIILMAMMGLLAVYLIQRSQKRSARRAALSELQMLEEDYLENGNSSNLACGLSTLLRRITLLKHERSQVASLHGSARAQSLNTISEVVSPSLIASIEIAMYQATSHETTREEAMAWLNSVRKFIRSTS